MNVSQNIHVPQIINASAIPVLMDGVYVMLSIQGVCFGRRGGMRATPPRGTYGGTGLGFRGLGFGCRVNPKP
jgi:hypothetical protein